VDEQWKLALEARKNARKTLICGIGETFKITKECLINSD
jgi:hypothetical protein